MQTKQLNYIVEIARQQSLSGAARVLGVSQPALSQFLAAEEKSLNTQLFFSYQNKLYPTPAGAVYISAASEMIRIKEQTYRKILSYQADSIKTIQIGFVDPVTRRTAAKAVPLVCGQYPDVTVIPIIGREEQLKEQVARGEIDMAVFSQGDSHGSDENFYQFASREIYVVIPENFELSYPLMENSRNHELISLEEMRNFPFILPDRNTSKRQIIDRLFQEAGFEPNVIYTTSDFFLTRELVNAGFGIAFLPERLAERTDEMGCRVLALTSHPAEQMGIVLSRGREPDGVERLLIYCILQRAAREEGDSLLYNGQSRRIMESYDGREGYQWIQDCLNT